MSAASVVLPPSAATLLPLDDPVIPVVDTPAVDYEPFLPDKKYTKTSPPELLTLTEKQEAIYQEVLAHFASADYVIPGVGDADGGLTEEERFYLVSPLLMTSPTGHTEDLNGVQTYECFLRWANCIVEQPHHNLICSRSLGFFEPQGGTPATASQNSKPPSSGDASTEYTTPSPSNRSKNTYVPFSESHVRLQKSLYAL